MTMMNANFIARVPRVMVTDGNHEREKHVISRRNTLQPIIRFFVHVVKTRFKAGQLEINRSSQDCAGASKRTRQMFEAKVCLPERFGILICALGKMQYGQFGPLFKERDNARYTV
jgi:hypothetical protein